MGDDSRGMIPSSRRSQRAKALNNCFDIQRISSGCVKNQRANGNLQVGRVDPVPALSLKATQRKSGDRVHLPDLQFKGLERSSWRLPAGSR